MMQKYWRQMEDLENIHYFTLQHLPKITSPVAEAV